MMIVLLTLVLIAVALVAWSLHLMQEAIQRREFSLMLAGTLVAMAAAALMGVYFLMGHYVGYVAQMAHYTLDDQWPAMPEWVVQADNLEIMPYSRDGAMISSQELRQISLTN